MVGLVVDLEGWYWLYWKIGWLFWKAGGLLFWNLVGWYWKGWLLLLEGWYWKIGRVVGRWLRCMEDFGCWFRRLVVGIRRLEGWLLFWKAGRLLFGLLVLEEHGCWLLEGSLSFWMIGLNCDCCFRCWYWKVGGCWLLEDSKIRLIGTGRLEGWLLLLVVGIGRLKRWLLEGFGTGCPF